MRCVVSRKAVKFFKLQRRNLPVNLRCKACAASLGDTSGMRMTECPRCGMLQSVPDPLLISLHDRANRFRLAGDFTEAARVYAQALAAEPNDADAHWGALLSCYGVRYTYEKTPLACTFAARPLPPCAKTSIIYPPCALPPMNKRLFLPQKPSK